MDLDTALLLLRYTLGQLLLPFFIIIENMSTSILEKRLLSLEIFYFRYAIRLETFLILINYTLVNSLKINFEFMIAYGRFMECA